MATFDAKDLEQFEQFVGETKTQVKLVKPNGDEMIFELECLPAKFFGRIVYVQEKMPKPRVLNPKEVKTGRPAIMENPEDVLRRLQADDYDIYGTLGELIETWILQSYPEIPQDKLHVVVTRNIPIFVSEFMKLHSDYNEETGKTKELKEFIAKKRQQQNEETETTQTNPEPPKTD